MLQQPLTLHSVSGQPLSAQCLQVERAEAVHSEKERERLASDRFQVRWCCLVEYVVVLC